MAGETITRLRQEETGRDRYDEPIHDEVETPIEGAFFAPGGTSEPTVLGAAPVVSEPTCYWRRQWPDIVDTDRLVVRGQTYTVEGFPADWRSPNGTGMGGLVVSLRRVK